MFFQVWEVPCQHFFVDFSRCWFHCVFLLVFIKYLMILGSLLGRFCLLLASFLVSISDPGSGMDFEWLLGPPRGGFWMGLGTIWDGFWDSCRLFFDTILKKCIHIFCVYWGRVLWLCGPLFNVLRRGRGRAARRGRRPLDLVGPFFRSFLVMYSHVFPVISLLLYLTLPLGTCFCNAPLLSALPVPLLRQVFV